MRQITNLIVQFRLPLTAQMGMGAGSSAYVETSRVSLESGALPDGPEVQSKTGRQVAVKGYGFPAELGVVRQQRRW